MKVVPLSLDVFEAWKKLFEASGTGCFCRYWHFEGTKNDWLARCAFDAPTNAQEQRDRLMADSPEALGLVALDEEGRTALGWLKLAPRQAVPKLRRLPVYKNLALGEDGNVFAIACLLVAPTHRRSGVAKALIQGAVDYARSRGAQAVEAYPRHAKEPISDEEAWMGPERVYQALGFKPFQGENPYPVYRVDLDGVELKAV